MGGSDVDAEVKKRRFGGDSYIRASDVKRDMEHMLSSLGWMAEKTGVTLLCDDRAVVQKIADDYGLTWPEKL